MIPLVTGLWTAGITILATPEAVARRAATLLTGALSAAIDERGRGVLALCGGRTPGLTFQELARRPLNWERVCVTLVDDRWVEPDSPHSHQRMVEENLLAGLATKARFLPVKNAAVSPLAGIGRHIRALQSAPLPIDAVLLGMGEDGHFASLFPRSSALPMGLDPESSASCVAVPVGQGGAAPRQERLSLTLGAIAKARAIVLLTSGDAKLRVLRRAIDTVSNPTELPIAALLAARPDTVILHERP